MKLAFAFVVIGIAIFAYSLTLIPYTDERQFNEQYLAMDHGDSEEYWKLRDQMLTPKFELQDYGLTVILVGLTLFLANLIRFRTPKYKWQIVVVAVGLPIVTVGGFVFDLLQGMYRGEFPHWADSLAIPLAGAPMQWFFLSIWACVHLVFLNCGYNGAVALTESFSKQSNWWLLAMVAVACLITIACTVTGAYMYAVPSVVWLYFYLSLAAERKVAK